MTLGTSFLRLLLGLLAAVATSEVVLRQVRYHPLAVDPDFDQVLEPGNLVRWQVEGHGVSHWDERGLRADQHPEPAKKTVLVLGDSFTEALMLDDNEVFTAHAQRALASQQVAVLNFGKSSLSVADYAFHAEVYRRRFAPDWVVVQLRDDDLLADAWKRAPGTARFVSSPAGLAIEGPHIVPMSRAKRSAFALRGASSLVDNGIVRFHQYREMAEREPPLFHASAQPPNPSERADYPIELELQALADAFAGRLTLLYLAEYDPRAPAAMTAVERRVSELCAQRGWSFVDSRAAWPALAERHEAPYGFANTGWNQGHLNALGHSEVAQLLVRELQRLLSNAVL